MGERRLSAERAARNESVFREANERIFEAARPYALSGGLPFICECTDPSCREIVRLSLGEYEAIRQEPTHFLIASGHAAAAQGWATVVSRRDGYDVVMKVGRAAELAAELDPRS